MPDVIPVQVFAPLLIRRGLAALLSRYPELTVVENQGQVWIVLAGTWEAAADSLHTEKQAPPAGIVLITDGDDVDLTRPTRMGIGVFVDAEASPAELRDGVAAAAEARSFCSPRLLSPFMQAVRQIDQRQRRKRCEDPLDTLTPRERVVALEAAQGFTDREIAARLYVSVTTVKSHLANVYAKLEISRRTQLARFLLELGAYTITVHTPSFEGTPIRYRAASLPIDSVHPNGGTTSEPKFDR